jgi:hypothetical protein
MPSTVVETLRAWHRNGSTIHHNHPQCSAGRRILVSNYIQGTGGHRLCYECEKLHIEVLISELEGEAG